MQLPQLASAQSSVERSQKGAGFAAVLVPTWSTRAGDVSPSNQSSPMGTAGLGLQQLFPLEPECWLMDVDKRCFLQDLACMQPLSWSRSGKMQEDIGNGMERLNNRECPQKSLFGHMKSGMAR